MKPIECHDRNEKIPFEDEKEDGNTGTVLISISVFFPSTSSVFFLTHFRMTVGVKKFSRTK